MIQKLRDHKTLFISASFVGVLLLAAVFSPYLSSFSFDEQNIDARLTTPNLTYWMGTDTLGRDLYSRILFGARMSLAVGITTALSSLILGTLVGAVAGYYGRWVDHLLTRVVDFFQIFPSLLFAILLSMVVGRGFFGIFLAISATAWIQQARLVRNQYMQAREMVYVEAARALGQGTFRILFRHILPNLWGPILVSVTFQIPTNIMAESFLSFIGLGLEPPYSSWGTLANEGFRAMRAFPHLIIFPGGILFATMLAFQFFGDGLKDFLDPKSRRD